MPLADLVHQKAGVDLLQRSLRRGRLAHAYLFSCGHLEELEQLASNLACVLNCLQPVRSPEGKAVDSCGHCLNCRRIVNFNHPDVQWVRPESKMRIITIDQMRDLMSTIHLKPTEAEYKVAMIVGADRMNPQAANAFLKTLEEPPSCTVFMLLTTEPGRVLETILSRCLRLNFGGDARYELSADDAEWMQGFVRTASGQKTGILERYKLLGLLTSKLTQIKEQTEKFLSARSPLEKYEDADARMRDKWEIELTAAVEAEYRRKRSSVLVWVQGWLRDIWLLREGGDPELLNWPDLESASRSVAGRISGHAALENVRSIEGLQRLLMTNVQEALALEVGLLKWQL